MFKQSCSTFADALFLAIAFVWAGMLVGVSFVATPVKFTAPSLSLPVALEVGRATFHLFSRIEWALAVALLLASVLGAGRAGTALAMLLFVVVVVQAVWLLPILDARVAAAVAGTYLQSSYHHMVYAVAEAAKLLLLAVAGASGLRAMHSRR